MLKRFSKQFLNKKQSLSSAMVSSPFNEVKDDKLKTPFLSGFTQHAIKLYEKKSDINKFTKLVLSDPDNLDCNDRVKAILSKEADDLFDLANNEKFLKDLGL